MTVSVGQIVSGSYWTKTWKGSYQNGRYVPMVIRRFEDGLVTGHTKDGRPIIELTSGNLKFKVTRTDLDA